MTTNSSGMTGMSKRQFKSQASSSRAVPGAFGGSVGTFSSGSLGVSLKFGAVSSSPLSCVYEPPDLAGISDPNIVVAFKNVQKKDSTTKEKALEDLQAYVLSLSVGTSEVEDSILEAWIKIYPRISIDSSRRVRQLAHTLQGLICLSYGKRIAKHLPKLIGAWLSGRYDNDRLVTRAAEESFSKVFTSDKKQKSVWNIYLLPILEFCRDTVFKENVQTLSDERTTSPDDAEAKYARVMGTSILLIRGAIGWPAVEEVKKHRSLYEELLSQDHVWKFAFYAEAFVRRAASRLLNTTLNRLDDILDLRIISTRFLADTLHIDHVGSALEYVNALARLSQDHPDVWTQYYPPTTKKSATKRLCQFLSKGSQGGPPDFWNEVSRLIKHVPLIILVPDQDDLEQGSSNNQVKARYSVLEALHKGIIAKDELQANQNTGWRTYLHTVSRLQPPASELFQRRTFFEISVVPILDQYLRPGSGNSAWDLPTSYQHDILLNASHLILENAVEVFEGMWNRLSRTLVEDLQTSLPEQSIDYVKSQDSIIGQATRRYSFQATILQSNNTDVIRSLLTTTSVAEVTVSVNTLKSRSGKSYSAAATVDMALRFMSECNIQDKTTDELVLEFARDDLPGLLLTPSSSHLISVLLLLCAVHGIHNIRQDCIRRLTNAPKSSTKYSALERLIASPWLGKAEDSEELVTIVKDSLQQAMDGNDQCWSLVTASMLNPSVPIDLTDELLTTITESLALDNRVATGLCGIEMAVKHNSQAIKMFSTSSKGSEMLSRLLFLADSSPHDEISLQAKSLSTSIDSILSNDKGPHLGFGPMVEIINKGLETASSTSISIESLVEQAQKVLDQTAVGDKSSMIAALLPDVKQWTAALMPIFEKTPDPSLAVTNALGSALIMIESPPHHHKPTVMAVMRDLEGYSIALRMAMYTVKLINTTDLFDQSTMEERVVSCRYIAVIIQLATDNLSVPQSNHLWEHHNLGHEADMVDFIADAQTLLASWLRRNASPDAAFINMTQDRLLTKSQELSTSSYYNARAYAAVTTDLVEVYGYSEAVEEEEQVRGMRKNPHFFAAAAFLAGYPESRALLRLCNECIADLGGHDFYDGSSEGTCQLVLLNSVVQRRPKMIEDVPRQRLVFAIKCVISKMQANAISTLLKTELYKVLAVLLPPVRDIYDSFWAEIFDSLLYSWSKLGPSQDIDIPLVHASLKLLDTLGQMAVQESNDDLQDAWAERQEPLMEALIGLVRKLSELPDETHHPRRIVNELLTRLLPKISSSSIGDPHGIYPVIASQSAMLQQCAYKLLHRHIWETQQQVSLDAALSKDFIARLPDELFSLILAQPKKGSFGKEAFARTIPITLRTYLLSWKLIFDHWTNASYKVQTDYAESVKDGDHLKGLLDFTFDFLIAARPKPVDASRFDIESYTVDTEEFPEKETQWLLVHLYYLSLKHLPALSVSWWRESSPRHLVKPVEAWTEKYMSPLIIASELSTISDWVLTQPTDDQSMIVKVSPRAHELTASYPIDDQQVSILIHLPLTYPLSRVTVSTLHRVGLDEKKWNSWLLTTQGVINFSPTSGALIDGLVAWRKNVSGMLKGQSECAICYSVVGQDKQLPSKKCGTCKNLFHGGCLFKWFKSSNSSSCPLCRNAFHYG